MEKFANLECLKKYHSNIYELFMEKKDQTVVAVRTVITREGSHACVINTDTGEVYLNSRYSPKREAKKWAEQFEFQNSDINIMMFGFGNGIFVRELLKNMPQNSRLIIYEPHGDIFHEILKLYDITDILSDKRIFLCIEGKEHFFFQNLLSEIVQWSNVPTQIHCIHPGYKKLYMEEYKEFQRIIREENEKAYINQNTVIHFAKKSIRNIIQNLHFIGESNYILDYSEKIPEEIPMIIVAAGPSLKKNVEELRGAKGKAIIVAVDTAVRFLDEKHIDYDWAITVDPNKPKEYMVNISSCKEKTLICVLDSQAEILNYHTGKKIWLQPRSGLEKVYERCGKPFPTFSCGFSVATAAFSLGVALGIKKIILVGQDLAYLGTETHIMEGETSIENEESSIQLVEGIDGELVYSRGDWILFRNWFEKYLKAGVQAELIDATEGGALIHGSKVMKLSEAVELFCYKEYNVEELIKSIPPTFSDEEYAEINKELTSILLKLEETEKKVRQGKECCLTYLSLVNTSGLSQDKYNEIMKGIQEINQFLSQKGIVIGLLDLYVSSLSLEKFRNLNVHTKNLEKDELALIEGLLSLYKAYIEGIQEIRQMLAESKG